MRFHPGPILFRLPDPIQGGAPLDTREKYGRRAMSRAADAVGRKKLATGQIGDHQRFLDILERLQQFARWREGMLTPRRLLDEGSLRIFRELETRRASQEP